MSGVQCGCKFEQKKRSFGALVDSLLDDAFSVLQHDTGESDPEWHNQRKWLADKFLKTLRGKIKK